MNQENKKTIETYDRIAKQYSEKNKKIAPAVQRDFFVSLLPKGGTILDAGCGYGRDAIYFSDRGFKVTAFDPSTGLINIAKEKNSKIDFLIGDLSTVSFPNGSFDGIWCNAVIHHLSFEDQEKAVSKLVSFLKSGGILYLLNRVQDEENVGLAKEGPEESLRYFYYSTAQNYRSMAEKNGCVIVKETQDNKRKSFGPEFEDVDTQCLFLRKK
jgi:ubiquinone/menaquinone biosynthesis C-methylase UbiE